MKTDNKKEEMTDYMKSAVALVKTYVPPSPGKARGAAAVLVVRMPRAVAAADDAGGIGWRWIGSTAC